MEYSCVTQGSKHPEKEKIRSPVGSRRSKYQFFLPVSPICVDSTSGKISCHLRCWWGFNPLTVCPSSSVLYTLKLLSTGLKCLINFTDHHHKTKRLEECYSPRRQVGIIYIIAGFPILAN